MPLEITPSDKFAVISFSRDVCEDMPDEGIQLSENCWCTKTLPFELDNIWEVDLGNLTSSEIRKSKFFIVAKRLSKVPQILDQEVEDLKQEVLHFRLGLLLLGMPRSQTQYLMAGTHSGVIPRISSHSELEMLYRIPDSDELIINLSQLKKAFVLGSARRILYANNDKFGRIKRGLHALFRSFEEDEMGSRFHDLVRSVEAVISPRVGKTGRDFVNRCSAITTTASNTRQILEEIYNTRSKVEHMHHYFEGVAHYPESERENIAFLRLRQLDQLARVIYLQILEDASLLRQFETDESIQALWSDSDIQKLWQRSLDISAIV